VLLARPESPSLVQWGFHFELPWVSSSGPVPMAERIPRFFREGFVVGADEGPPLSGWVEGTEVCPRVRRDEITDEPIPVNAEEEGPVVFVRLADCRPRAVSGRASLVLTPW